MGWDDSLSDERPSFTLLLMEGLLRACSASYYGGRSMVRRLGGGIAHVFSLEEATHDVWLMLAATQVSAHVGTSSARVREKIRIVRVSLNKTADAFGVEDAAEPRGATEGVRL